MTEWAFRKLGSDYIVVMMLVTRVFGSIGGALALYYISLTSSMPPPVHRCFEAYGNFLVAVAVAVTIPLALWETRTLRSVLRRLRDGLPVEREQAHRASHEAVLFPVRNQLHQAVAVPLFSVVPMCVLLRLRADASNAVLVHVTIGGGLAIAAVLLITFFVSEKWIQPVIRHLLDRGLPVEFDAMPPGRQNTRMTVCFSMILVVTALMIGTLANERALDIIRNPEHQAEAVADLRRHMLYILLAAVAVGLACARLLSNSVASRVHGMVQAMKRVESGSLSERLQPTGTDEIDVLGRQFNAMVEQLDHNDRLIRDLNANLERKVKRRTRQLSRSKRSLQRSLQKLREYDQLKT
jgi:HAMP domain-containing protein